MFNVSNFQFAVGLLVIFIVELAVGIAAACYNAEFQDGLKSALRKSMDRYDNVDADKQAWDNVQQKVWIYYIFRKFLCTLHYLVINS